MADRMSWSSTVFGRAPRLLRTPVAAFAARRCPILGPTVCIARPRHPLPREREGQRPIHSVVLGSIPDSISNMCSLVCRGGTWQDPDLGRPIAAPLQRCAELLGVEVATVRELAAKLEPYVRADGTRIWSLMQLERQLRPEAYGRRRGGYVDRRQT